MMHMDNKWTCLIAQRGSLVMDTGFAYVRAQRIHLDTYRQNSMHPMHTQHTRSGACRWRAGKAPTAAHGGLGCTHSATAAAPHNGPMTLHAMHAQTRSCRRRCRCIGVHARALAAPSAPPLLGQQPTHYVTVALCIGLSGVSGGGAYAAPY